MRRRIERRLQELELSGYEEYQDHLEVDPREFVTLFNTILINVTGFLRDPAAWQALRVEVIPAIGEGKQDPSDPIRIWSAACASGQETYSVAMLFAEAMEAEDFEGRVKIYGTDVDEDALDRSRRAVYSSNELESLPADLVERYFEQTAEDRFAFDRELRRSVIFGRHDLVRDAPISRLDLLICRNTLMYFNADIRTEILRRFHFALRDDGYLFLGKAETLVTSSELYVPVDLRHRIFQRLPLEDRLLAPSRVNPAGGDDDDHGDGVHADLVVAAFGAAPVPHLVVSDGGYLVAANDAARRALGLRPAVATVVRADARDPGATHLRWILLLDGQDTGDEHPRATQLPPSTRARLRRPLAVGLGHPSSVYRRELDDLLRRVFEGEARVVSGHDDAQGCVDAVRRGEVDVAVVAVRADADVAQLHQLKRYRERVRIVAIADPGRRPEHRAPPDRGPRGRPHGCRTGCGAGPLARCDDGWTTVPEHVRADVIGREAARRRLLGDLSDEDVDLLGALSRGAGDAELAAARSVSERTIKRRLSRLYRKLGVDSRIGAAAAAGRMGLAEGCTVG